MDANGVLGRLAELGVTAHVAADKILIQAGLESPTGADGGRAGTQTGIAGDSPPSSKRWPAAATGPATSDRV